MGSRQTGTWNHQGGPASASLDQLVGPNFQVRDQHQHGQSTFLDLKQRMSSQVLRTGGIVGSSGSIPASDPCAARLSGAY